MFLGFSAFIVYSTWAALQGNNYEFGPYLSPFYSPLLMTDQARLVAGVHAVLGGDADSVGARRLPLHLLLLSRRLLQSVLGRSAVLHRRRAAQEPTGANERSR